MNASLKKFLKLLSLSLVAIVLFSLASYYLVSSYIDDFDQKLLDGNIEEIIKSASEQLNIKQCNDFIMVAESITDCPKFLQNDYRDNCYYCFALIGQDASLCEEINDDKYWLPKCKKEFVEEYISDLDE